MRVPASFAIALLLGVVLALCASPDPGTPRSVLPTPTAPSPIPTPPIGAYSFRIIAGGWQTSTAAYHYARQHLPGVEWEIGLFFQQE